MPHQTDESCAELAHSDKLGLLIRLYHEGITQFVSGKRTHQFILSGLAVFRRKGPYKSSFEYSFKLIFKNTNSSYLNKCGENMHYITCSQIDPLQ